MTTTTAVAADFMVLQRAVQQRFAWMQSYPLFRVDVPGDHLWETYLSSFPEGTNPIYRARREYDCSCCKHFIRAIGNVVAIVDGKVETLWDIDPVGVPEYMIVTNALATVVRAHPISDIFLHAEGSVGVLANRVQDKNGAITTWRHFHLTLPSTLVNTTTRDTRLGEARTTKEVFTRGLTDITTDSIETVLDLIKQNSLYRGEEHRQNVAAFLTCKRQFDRLALHERELFCWHETTRLNLSVLRLRNTVIGTLLTDLSEGIDLERAVKSFEQKVAPTNYKRPTALVTKAMIEKAKTKLDELGLTPALERRYAVARDLSVDNVLFVDRSTKGHLKGSVLDTLAPTKPVSRTSLTKIEEISLDKFLRDVLPVTTKLELFVENRHAPNFMSLIAPVHEDAPQLFKWSNGFSWSYAGDLADSIKERVKRAGGNVTGDLRCSLSWFNYDDLDLHMVEPGSYEIYYPNARRLSPSRGVLDVDMNAGLGRTRTPVENISYESRRTMRDGVYVLRVHQFSKRETQDVGFVVEIEFDGAIHTVAFREPMPQGKLIEIAQIQYSKREGFKILKSLPSESVSRTIWNIPTQQFHPVTMVTLSPNHWNGSAIGNKHVFFMLDRCTHDGQVRGFFNEFLRSDLDQHRKVMELVGSKVRTDESDQQLSGLGFSSTQRDHFVCKVSGSFTRQLKVIL